MIFRLYDISSTSIVLLLVAPLINFEECQNFFTKNGLSVSWNFVTINLYFVRSFSLEVFEKIEYRMSEDGRFYRFIKIKLIF